MRRPVEALTVFVISLALAGPAGAGPGAPAPRAPGHADLACAACHPGGVSAAQPVVCASGSCHARIAEKRAASRHDAEYLKGSAPSCVLCHGGHPVVTGADAAGRVCDLKVETRCLSCHAAERYVVGPGPMPPGTVVQPDRNIHAAARRAKGCRTAGISCFTCHGMHGTAALDDPESPVSRNRVASTCGRCHRKERKEYLESIHGRGLERGNPWAPTCVSCHGAHGVLGARARKARTSVGKVVYTCAECHEDPRVIKAAGLPGNAVLNYERSLHGIAYRCGIRDVATCISCHGYHAVFRSDAPPSLVSQQNIRRTCGSCHAVVTERMIDRILHVARGGTGEGSGAPKLYFPVAGTALNPFLASGIGGLVGFLSGIFGVGGGFLMTPLLVFIGIPAAVAAATDSAQITAGASSGMFSHARLGNVDFKMGLAMVAGSWPGGFLGVHVVHALRAMGNFDFYLKLLYVLLLGFTGITMLIESIRSLRGASHREEPGPGAMARLLGRLPFRMRFPKSGLEVSVLLPIGAGLLVGILAAFLGVGGGFILMPVMIYIIGIPTRVAVGTGLFQIMLTCAYVTVQQSVSNHTVDVVLALALFLGSTLGAQLGVLASRRLRGEQIRGLLALIVLAVMVALLWGLVTRPDMLIQFARSGGG